MKENRNIKALIFDLDGTLLDSIKDIAGATNKGLAEMELPTHEIDSYKSFVGHGHEELIKRALPAEKRDQKYINKLIEIYKEHYETEWQLSTQPFHGILHLIKVAVANKTKLAILSNKDQYFTKKMIRYYFRGAMISHTKNPFGIYSGATKDKPNKPDPTTALELAKRLSAEPKDIAIVGDMPVDMLTAKNAGMVAYGAAWGYAKKEMLETAGADLIFDSPVDLAKHVQKYFGVFS